MCAGIVTADTSDEIHGKESLYFLASSRFATRVAGRAAKTHFADADRRKVGGWEGAGGWMGRWVDR